jgi:hypothetical protein
MSKEPKMDTTAKRGASARTKRTPVTERQPLRVTGKEAGFEYRIVNDTGDRVLQLQQAGYELVPAKGVTVGDRRVDTGTAEGSIATVSVGQGQKAVLMRQQKEWYDEDYSAKQQRVDELEATTKRKATSEADYGKIEISRS